MEKYRSGTTVKSFHIAISQSFVAVLFIAIDFIFSKKLEVNDFGLWKEVFFLLNLGIPLVSFGFAESYKFFIAKDIVNVEYYLNNVILIFFRIGIILFTILCVFNLFHFFNLVNLGSYYLYSIFFPLPLLAYLLNKILRYTYININLEEKLTMLSIYGALSSLCIVFLGCYILDLKPEYYIGVAILTYFSVFFFPSLFYFYNSGLTFKVLSIDKGILKKLWVYGFPLYLATFTGLFSAYLDKAIVNIFEDDTTFAIFAVGAFEIPIFAMFSAAFSQQIFPKMVRLIESNKESEAKLLWLLTTKKVSFITYPFILLAMFFADDIIFFVYSKDYTASVTLFKTYLLVLLFRNNNYGILLTAKGQTKLITKISLLVLFLNLIVSVGLYYFLGIRGVVFGTLFSTSVMWIIYLVKEDMLKRYLQIVTFNKLIFVLQILIIIAYLR
ncbi:lipopolysaccharide biosynthesis protein [Dokdonia sp. Asnod2-E02]|uniref:lipopolysaccharide biosynthesis protein n=1 Tax=Dokdonia sp. Asnod2-E02 TaxID=3160574 RepID=UPI00386C9C04